MEVGVSMEVVMRVEVEIMTGMETGTRLWSKYKRAKQQSNTRYVNGSHRGRTVGTV